MTGVKLTGITDGTSNTAIIGERPSMHGRVGTTMIVDCHGWVRYLEYETHAFAVVTGSVDFPLYQTSNGVRFPNGSSCPFPMGFQPGDVRELCDASHLWSKHTNGANFAFGDGSVRFLSYSVGLTVIRQLSTRAGGEVVSNF